MLLHDLHHVEIASDASSRAMQGLHHAHCPKPLGAVPSQALQAARAHIDVIITSDRYIVSSHLINRLQYHSLPVGLDVMDAGAVSHALP